MSGEELREAEERQDEAQGQETEEENEFDASWDETEEDEEKGDALPASSSGSGKESDEQGGQEQDGDETKPTSKKTEPEPKREPEAVTPDELAALRAELEAARKQLASMRQPPKPDAEKKPPAAKPSVPDEIKEAFAAFQAKYPEMAHLAMEDSRLGAGIRARLKDYGADDAADYAAPAFEARMASVAAQNRQQEQQRHDDERRVAEFQATVLGECPDLKAAFDAGSGPQYIDAVRKWAEGKPYREATEIMRIFDGGTAAETIGLIRRYTEETKANKGKFNKDAAAALHGVPGKNRPAGFKPAPKKDEFDEAWDEED
ncbi:MAG: hypothetical protein LBP61_08250 [Desulfovibrio sp.]|jgi:hypothetical protein|nr:hypothetical protein [Desulfovibrio sp.]